MKKAQRRLTIYAWLLLTVFTAMVALSSLHQHGDISSSVASQAHCELCVHHVAHSGHISARHISIDDCVLCQFLNLSYTAPAATGLAFFLTFILAVTAAGMQRVTAGMGRPHPSRGPPSLVF